MAERSGGEGLFGWLVGGIAAGAVVLGLLVAAYAIGYDHGRTKAKGPSAPVETAPATTTESTTPSGGDVVAEGKGVFASAGCASCHTLADAGATGSLGPDLDQVKPSEQLVVDRVKNGKGLMPSFEDQLTDEQIRAVAAYVSGAATER